MAQSGLAIRTADLLIVERAELDAGDVTQADHGTIRVRADGDRTELLLRLQPSLRPDGVGHFLAGRCRHLADLPGGIDRALLANRIRESGTVSESRASASGLTQMRIA